MSPSSVQQDSHFKKKDKQPNTFETSHFDRDPETNKRFEAGFQMLTHSVQFNLVLSAHSEQAVICTHSSYQLGCLSRRLVVSSNPVRG